MFSMNLFVLRENTRYCMTKGLVNPDVVIKRGNAVYKYGGERTETRPCTSLLLPDSQKRFICELVHQHTFIYYIMHLPTLEIRKGESGRTGYLRAVELCRDVGPFRGGERMRSVYSEGICDFSFLFVS